MSFDPTRRGQLVQAILYTLRGVRNSRGYTDTAEQIADALIERMPVTAQQVSLVHYLDRLANERVTEASRARDQATHWHGEAMEWQTTAATQATEIVALKADLAAPEDQLGPHPIGSPEFKTWQDGFRHGYASERRTWRHFAGVKYPQDVGQIRRDLASARAIWHHHPLIPTPEETPS